MQEVVDKSYHRWHEATQKLDYFILGILGALVAYLAQGLGPVTIGANPSTVELVSVLLFLSSMVAGFRRVECTNMCLGGIYRRLQAEERMRSLQEASNKGIPYHTFTFRAVTPDEFAQIHKEISLEREAGIREFAEWAPAALRWYLLRNAFMALGIVALVASKIQCAS